MSYQNQIVDEDEESLHQFMSNNEDTQDIGPTLLPATTIVCYDNIAVIQSSIATHQSKTIHFTHDHYFYRSMKIPQQKLSPTMMKLPTSTGAAAGMMSYQNQVVEDDEESNLIVGNNEVEDNTQDGPLCQPTTTTKHWFRCLECVAAATTFLLVIAGGRNYRTNTVTASLYVDDDTINAQFVCVDPSSKEKFSGTSHTGELGGQAFETCFKKDGYDTYCWSKSCYSADDGTYKQCVPQSPDGWHAISASECREPCTNTSPVEPAPMDDDGHGCQQGNTNC